MTSDLSPENEIARQEFVHFCRQYNQMGKLLSALVQSIYPIHDSTVADCITAMIAQYHQMGDQLKVVCTGLESLTESSPLNGSPNDN